MLRTSCQWKAVPVRCIRGSCSGSRPGSSRRCERPVLPNTTSFKASLRRGKALRRDPEKKARRWVMQACHGWLNRFRKSLVRYKKLEHTFLALNYFTAAIPCARLCCQLVLFTDKSQASSMPAAGRPPQKRKKWVQLSHVSVSCKVCRSGIVTDRDGPDIRAVCSATLAAQNCGSCAGSARPSKSRKKASSGLSQPHT